LVIWSACVCVLWSLSKLDRADTSIPRRSLHEDD
jgi:hypothetical protein